MRIALFTETFLPKTDGIVNTLCQLLDHLARRGHVSLVFAPAGGPASYAGMPVIGLPAVPFPIYPELRLVPPAVNVSERLIAFSPDLIHVFNPVSLGIAGLRHARQLGLPVAASYQTDLPGFAARWGYSVICCGDTCAGCTTRPISTSARLSLHCRNWHTAAIANYASGAAGSIPSAFTRAAPAPTDGPGSATVIPKRL